MIDFIAQLRLKNETLYYFGWICFWFSVFCLGMSYFSKTEVNNVSAWIKPFKFSFSTLLYAWSMAWFCYELKDFNISIFNWSVVVLLGFEIVYIAIQAARGQLSHFNISSSFYAAMYSLMALAATAVTVYTAYIGYLFFEQSFPHLPDYYLWSIRLGIVLFVIFAFEGFVMGSRLSHTIGGKDGSPGIPLLHWSNTFGDPRVAHFIGMHALQILPLISFYGLKDKKITLFVGVLYFILAFYTLIQAIQGKPLIQNNQDSISDEKTIQHKKNRNG